MKLRILLLVLSPFSLFSQEFIFMLGEKGKIVYVHEGERLLKVRRESSMGDVLYSHEYRYSEDGKLLSESLIGEKVLKSQINKCIKLYKRLIW